MKTKVFLLTLIFIFLLKSDVFAAEKLPDDVLKAFLADVEIFQKQILAERDLTHHLSDEEIFQSKYTGYRSYRLDPNKILNGGNIDLYDALIIEDKWYIPTSDRIVYEVEKINGVYKLIGYGVYEKSDAISYEEYEKRAQEMGLKDLVYINEPALHIRGFIGKGPQGTKLLSFTEYDNLKLQKNKLTDGKELIEEIRNYVNEAKTNKSQGFGGVKKFDSNQTQTFLLIIVFGVIGLLAYKKIR